jgi:hypothetical protein
MATGTTAVALAVRAHPRGGAPSGDDATVRALRDAAASVGSKNPEMLSGPSSLTPEGTLLLALSAPAAVLEAILLVANELRPLGTTFCAAVAAGRAERGPVSPDHVESSLIAAEAAASLALRGIEETDVRDRRVSLLSPGHDALASSLACMVLVSYDAMTERQRQMISLIKECETQQQVATHLDISRQAVNQSLSAAGWTHLKLAESVIRDHLSSGPRGGETGRRER